MDLSVVVCTRNRARSLARFLESAARLDVPAGLDWELLVIDNGSTDHTSEIIERNQSRLPLRRAVLDRPGLSLARNYGVELAEGRYIVWADDDVVPHTQWLAAYAQAFSIWPSDVLFAGKITPVLEAPVTDWFRDNVALFGDLLAARDFGPTPLPLSVAGNRIPYGANFAIRADAQRLNLYDPELGVAPGRLRVGEESAVVEAILNQGGQGHWVPAAAVDHMIASERQTARYVVKYQIAQGRTHFHDVRKISRMAAGSVLLRHAARLILSAVLYLLWRGLGRTPKWAVHLKAWSFELGVVTGPAYVRHDDSRPPRPEASSKG